MEWEKNSGTWRSFRPRDSTVAPTQCIASAAHTKGRGNKENYPFFEEEEEEDFLACWHLPFYVTQRILKGNFRRWAQKLTLLWYAQLFLVILRVCVQNEEKSVEGERAGKGRKPLPLPQCFLRCTGARARARVCACEASCLPKGDRQSVTLSSTTRD